MGEKLYAENTEDHFLRLKFTFKVNRSIFIA